MVEQVKVGGVHWDNITRVKGAHMNFNDEVASVVSRLRRGDKSKVLLYLHGGTESARWEVAKSDSVRGAILMQDYEKFMVGIYETGVPYDLVFEDMAFMVNAYPITTKRQGARRA